VSEESPLARLYAEIHHFASVRDKGGTPLRIRNPLERALQSDVVLLAQGLAKGTQRVTGYPYRKPGGLSQAGQRLDGFLKPLGYTIDHTAEGRIYAYSTDLVPWYPGRHPRGKGDLRPSARDVNACWEWFERECQLVAPRAVILLGTWAAVGFLRRYSSQRLTGRLEDATGHAFTASIEGNDVIAVAAFHPAAIWGRYEEPGRESWRGVRDVLMPMLIESAK
jgi:uracil-DNA glycosylase family 4